MTEVHEKAVPHLHGRLHEAREAARQARALARALAECLDSEIDARHREPNERLDSYRRRKTGEALRAAREAGLL